MGVLVHGIGSFLYLARDNIPKGSNFTIECIQRTLLNVMKIKNIQYLPRTMFLQSDNTAADAKNKWVFTVAQNFKFLNVQCVHSFSSFVFHRYVLAYLALTAKSRVFQSIYFSCLPVGHTHEDIDQFFSRYLHSWVVSFWRSVLSVVAHCDRCLTFCLVFQACWAFEEVWHSSLCRRSHEQHQNGLAYALCSCLRQRWCSCRDHRQSCSIQGILWQAWRSEPHLPAYHCSSFSSGWFWR